MTLAQRLILCAVVLSLGVATQQALQAHLGAVKEGAFATLRAPLNDIPLALKGEGDESGVLTWQGAEHPAREAVVKQVPFADEVFYRSYQLGENGPYAGVYMAYSRTGEDRKHHPEICMREAAGAPEDLSARLLVPLTPAETSEGKSMGIRQAQRFRFRTSTAQHLVMYYWHYTFPSRAHEGESGLQQLHRRLLASPPSISVQVSTPYDGDDLKRVEASFLPALDAAVRRLIVPEGTAVGCDRVPITMIRR